MYDESEYEVPQTHPTINNWDGIKDKEGIKSDWCAELSTMIAAEKGGVPRDWNGID